ncbi:MAG: HD domain-containing protein [Planctomycetes bacterium]|nr:HD domain-containing protein [Planctomycetota bacterium]
MDSPNSTDVRDLISDFLDCFTILSQRFQLYGRDHPRTRESWAALDAIRSRLARALPSRVEKLAIACHNGRFYFENAPLRREPQQALLLKRCFEKSGLGGMLVSLGIEEAALKQVLGQVATGKTRLGIESPPEGFRWMSSAEIHRYQDGHQGELNVNAVLSVADVPLQAQVYNEAMTALSSFNKECSAGRDAGPDAVAQAARCLVEAVLSHPREILPQATAHYYAEFMLYHSVNVSILALSAASLLTRDPGQLELIAQAGLLHDVGAALLGEQILCKDQPLTEEETALLMEHPEKGARLLQSISGLHPIVITAAFGHHVKGAQGYPRALSEYQTGPVTRLVEIADIFEALTAYRPYKRAITAPLAFLQLYAEPSLARIRQYVDLLAQAIGFHPVGTKVRTREGEQALVCGHVEADPQRPIIRLIVVSPDGDRGLGCPQEAACGDLSWSKPAEDAKVVVTAIDPLEDLKRAEETRDSAAEPARCEPAW